MSNKQAQSRYFAVFIPSMTVFVASSVAIAWLDNAGMIRVPLLYAAAVVPIASMLLVFWSHWRFINDIDEYLRSIHLRGIIGGLFVILAIATGWGYLELYADAPKLGMFWLNPIYWMAYGLITALNHRLETGTFE